MIVNKFIGAELGRMPIRVGLLLAGFGRYASRRVLTSRHATQAS